MWNPGVAVESVVVRVWGPQMNIIQVTQDIFYNRWWSFVVPQWASAAAKFGSCTTVWCVTWNCKSSVHTPNLMPIFPDMCGKNCCIVFAYMHTCKNNAAILPAHAWENGRQIWSVHRRPAGPGHTPHMCYPEICCALRLLMAAPCKFWTTKQLSFLS